MSILLEQFRNDQKRKVIPDIHPGDVIRVHERIKEAKGERIQIFEGLVITRKHGSEPGATFTVRKISSGIGVERTFPIHSPLIEKVEITKRSKVRRSKLYYMRERSGKSARMRGVERSDVFDMKQTQETEENNEPEVPEDNTENPGSAEEVNAEEMEEAQKEETEESSDNNTRDSDKETTTEKAEDSVVKEERNEKKEG